MDPTEPADMNRGSGSKNGLLVSAIIASYTLDRLKDIQEVIDSLATGTYPHIEIIVVTERDRELQRKVQEYVEENNINNSQIIFNDGIPSLAQARNLGIEHATGDILAFIDDDVIASPEWAQEMVNTYNSHPEAAGVTGSAIPAWQEPGMEWLPKEFQWIISCTGWLDEEGKDNIRVVRNGWGMNVSVRREALGDIRFVLADWAAHGGNKLGLEGDDTDLCLAVTEKHGGVFLYNSRVAVHHKVYPYRLSSWFIRQKSFCQGMTKAALQKRYPNLNMSTEYTLIRQILLRFFPRLLLEAPKHPVITWKRLILSVYALFSLALGFFSGKYPRIGKFIARVYWR